MNNPTAPLWQQMGQAKPPERTQRSGAYTAALERKRKRQQAKIATRQQEARILPLAPPQMQQQVQPFGSYAQQTQAPGVMPWNAMSRRY